MTARLLDPTLEARLLHAARPSSVFWQRAATPGPSVRLFGLSFENSSIDRIAKDLVRAAVAAQRQHVVFVNAHVVNVMRREPEFAEVVAHADRRYADGSGLAIAARLHEQSFVDNANGTDLFPILCRSAEESGVKIFLLGGEDGIAARAAETLAAAGCGGAIAGTHHGFFGAGSADEASVIETINASGASIVLVGMGVPYQEQWIARNGRRLKPTILIGVGGLFDFFSGRTSRAPQWLRSLGLEWTWRLAQEPKRMWRRYVVGNVSFLSFAVRSAWQIRFGILPNDEFSFEDGAGARRSWNGRLAGSAGQPVEAHVTAR